MSKHRRRIRAYTKMQDGGRPPQQTAHAQAASAGRTITALHAQTTPPTGKILLAYPSLEALEDFLVREFLEAWLA